MADRVYKFTGSNEHFKASKDRIRTKYFGMIDHDGNSYYVGAIIAFENREGYYSAEVSARSLERLTQELHRGMWPYDGMIAKFVDNTYVAHLITNSGKIVKNVGIYPLEKEEKAKLSEWIRRENKKRTTKKKDPNGIIPTMSPKKIEEKIAKELNNEESE